MHRINSSVAPHLTLPSPSISISPPSARNLPHSLSQGKRSHQNVPSFKSDSSQQVSHVPKVRPLSEGRPFSFREFMLLAYSFRKVKNSKVIVEPPNLSVACDDGSSSSARHGRQSNLSAHSQQRDNISTISVEKPLDPPSPSMIARAIAAAKAAKAAREAKVNSMFNALRAAKTFRLARQQRNNTAPAQSMLLVTSPEPTEETSPSPSKPEPDPAPARGTVSPKEALQLIPSRLIRKMKEEKAKPLSPSKLLRKSRPEPLSNQRVKRNGTVTLSLPQSPASRDARTLLVQSRGHSKEGTTNSSVH